MSLTPAGYRRTEFIHRVGLAADRPDPEDVLIGTLYFSTDTLTLERSNGTVWTAFAGTGSVPGSVGPVGPTGATGPAGIQGEQGLEGEQGIPGPAGATGPAGPQGIQGIEGPEGPAGPSGLSGLAGTAWTVFSPVFTNLTVGNGAIAGREMTVEDATFFFIQLIWGTTTVITGTPVYVALPRPCILYAFGMGIARCLYFSSVAGRFHTGMSYTPNDSQIALLVGNSPMADMEYNEPFLWTAGDQLYIQGMYQHV